MDSECIVCMSEYNLKTTGVRVHYARVTTYQISQGVKYVCSEQCAQIFKAKKQAKFDAYMAREDAFDQNM